MENKDLFTEFNSEDLNKLFDMSQFDAFADMDIPSFESINDDFKAMEKNLKSEFEPLGDSYDFDFDFDFDFGFKEFEKEFDQQFKESAPSKDTFQKIFTRKDEAERKRAVKDLARKEKEKLAKAEKQALAKIKAEKAAAKAAKKVVERKTPKAIEALCQKYYGFVDKVQRRIDEIEGERIEAETQRYIVSKYKKAEKVKTPAKAKVKETQHVDYLKLAKNRLSNAYYTWAVVWDQLDEERELRKIDKLTIKHNKEYLQ